MDLQATFGKALVVRACLARNGNARHIVFGDDNFDARKTKALQPELLQGPCG
jgi:hypothetical protein